MFDIVEISRLETSMQSLWLIGLILLVRRYFNVKSTKWANITLWTILFIYLLAPYSILIDINKLSSYGFSKTILELIVVINDYTKLITTRFGSILSAVNRIIVGSLISLYIIYQIYKMKKILKHSSYAPKNSTVDFCINLFHFRRKIQVLVNDNIKMPVTYGIIKPKVILQSRVLKDDKLLRYVLIHELTHIKKFDIVYSHIKNLISCLYWYNLFIIVASRYMEDNLEILCDKLVIKKVGDTSEHRKEYCISMLQMIEENDSKMKFVLKMSPSMERMIVMKEWKKSLAGIMSFVIVAALSTSVFADVNKSEKKLISSSEMPTIEENIQSNQVRVITDEEYNSLELGDNLLQPEFVLFFS